MPKNNSISIIIPCFDEEKRILNLINEIQNFKTENTLEVIIVNDGSNDKTLSFIKSSEIYQKKIIKLISYKKNKGKGFAIFKGVIAAKNEWIISLDADLSISLSDAIKSFNKYAINKDEIYVGSRSHNKSIVKSQLHRFLIGIVFQALTRFFLKIQIKDTQCGFKIYHYKNAKKLFTLLKDYSFSHDIEIILHCKKLEIKVNEIPVIWKHMNGSKVNLFTDPIKMMLKIFYFKFKSI